MSTINRRAFVGVCLAVPMAGCVKPSGETTSDKALPSLRTSCDNSSYPVRFLNSGCWMASNTPIFVVTGNFP